MDDVGLEHAVPREAHFDMCQRVDWRQVVLHEAREHALGARGHGIRLGIEAAVDAIAAQPGQLARDRVAHIGLISPVVEVAREQQVMVGPLVGLCARNFKVDKFFIGIDGMDESGVKSSDHLRIEAAQAMAAQARGIIVLTESIKFHRDASELLFPYENIRSIYTDADVSPDDVAELEARGLAVITAGKPRT